MEVVISVVGKLTEYSVAPVVRQFGYLFHYESNVAHLSNQVEKLTAKRDGVILQIDAATRNLETILPEVLNWLDQVNQTLQDKETCFEKETTAKAECCSNGWFPNLKIRHSLSRKAKKMSPDIDSLLDKKFERVACSGPPPQLGFQPTQLLKDSTGLVTNLNEGASASGTSNNVDFESRKSTVRDVMEALKGIQFNPIVICGMGGIGKTTLVGEVVNKAKMEGLFDEYAKAIVNEKPDPSKIQSDVAEFLGLKLTEEGLEARADKLRKRLSATKRVLIVLDNVWETLDLWGIGIPSCPKNCKVLVTSRNQDIFNEMEETRKKFPIGVLPESDAWSLFKKVAGGYIESDPELRSIAEKVLRECDGLPVAISTIGSALRQKKKAIWKDALGLLQKPFRGDIQGMKKNVYQTIRLSYDFLERKEAKSCFLLCCVFPESTDILIEDLMTHALGLGLFQGIDSVEGGRDRVEALLDTLKSCYLLLDSDKEECVRIHDVVRAVGLYTASDESGGTFRVRHRVALEGLSPHYSCASLTVTANKTSPELLLLSCTDMEKSSSLEVPGTMNEVEELKVLDISVPYSDAIILSRLTSLPVLLRNIQTLCLKGLELELQIISVIGELRTLMILRLSGSTIEHIPEEFKNLCNLKLLDLADCWRLEVIPPGIISSLSKLEELYLWASMEKWDDAGIIGLSSELLDLPLLTRLDTELAPVVIQPNSMLLFDKLKSFKLNIEGRKMQGRKIRERPPRRGHIKKRIFKSLIRHHETMRLPEIPGDRQLEIMRLPENPGDNYLKLKNLDADTLVAVTVLLKKTHVLELKWNSSNDVAVHLLDPKVDFPVLKRLRISDMCNFKEIWNNQLSPHSFCELRELHVESCDKILHLVPTYMQARLQKLERINVWGCSSLQEIFQTNQGIMQINNQIMDFKVFQHLILLFVRGCDSLRKVCSSSIAKSLVNLEQLNIWNCRNMEEIVSAEEGEEAEDNSMFPHLRKLSLFNLPNLESFSRDKYALDWPSMESIRIRDCPKMKNFSSGSLITQLKMRIDIFSGVDENIRRELEMSKKEKPDMNV